MGVRMWYIPKMVVETYCYILPTCTYINPMQEVLCSSLSRTSSPECLNPTLQCQHSHHSFTISNQKPKPSTFHFTLYINIIIIIIMISILHFPFVLNDSHIHVYHCLVQSKDLGTITNMEYIGP